MKRHGDIKSYVAVAMVLAFSGEAKVWLEAPAVANIREDTTLTCHYCDTLLTNWTWSRGSGNSWYTFMVNGTQTGPSGVRTSVREEMNGSISLIIGRGDHWIRGSYKCSVGEYQSNEVFLQVESKPDHAVVRMMPDRHIEVQLRSVYPLPTINFMLTDETKADTEVLFHSRVCGGFSWAPDCTWISVNALPDGCHSYKLTVTTVTDTVINGNIN